MTALAALFVFASCDTLEEVITGEPSFEEIPGVQQWQCISSEDWTRHLRGELFTGKKVIVRLSRPAGEEVGFGEITVADTTHPAFFAVEGVNLRWVFGKDSQYSFIVRPDGSAGYYDFSGAEEGEKRLASQSYGCKSN